MRIQTGTVSMSVCLWRDSCGQLSSISIIIICVMALARVVRDFMTRYPTKERLHNSATAALCLDIARTQLHVYRKS